MSYHNSFVLLNWDIFDSHILNPPKIPFEIEEESGDADSGFWYGPSYMISKNLQT